jgi:hypothetical protein
MNSQIATFIQLINERMFAGSQLAAIQALWSEHTHFDKCESLVLRGSRVGQACGKPVLKGKQTCLCHQPRGPKVISVPKTKCSETLASGKPCPRNCSDTSDKCQFHLDYVVPETCPFTLVGGPRKGQECGKTCKKGMTVCMSHLEKTCLSRLREMGLTEPEPVVVVEEPVVVVVEPEVVVEEPVVVVEEPEVVVEEPEVVVVVTCETILKSGPRKGTRCGKKCVSENSCATHSSR